MKFRRILALALVGTMALSATAFAEGETTDITMQTIRSTAGARISLKR